MLNLVLYLIFQYLIHTLLVQKTDWYLDELRHELIQAGAEDISIATVWRYLKRANITHKKVGLNPWAN
jgi:hypothetical protein